MSNNYTDIAITDAVSVTEISIDDSTIRKNVAEDRYMLEFEGSTPQSLIDLGCTIRTHSEALAYYNNPDNGWYKESI